MRRFVVQRLVYMSLTIWGIATILFLLLRFMPGDPTTFFLDLGLSPENIERQKQLWGLSDPLWLQYFKYLYNMVTFQWGISFRMYEPAAPIVINKAMNTLALSLPAVLIYVSIGAVAGSFLGWRRGSKLESGIIAFALFVRSMPGFFFAILMLWIFSFTLQWAPSGGMITSGTNPSYFEMIFSLDFLGHLALPISTLVLGGFVGPLLLMRTSMIEIKGEDFLEIHKAKGLSDSQLVRHAARNALLPLVTSFAVTLATIWEGSVLFETIFNWPGMGRELQRSLLDQDYPVAQAVFFVGATAVVIANFVADILYGYLDPRVKYD